MRINNQVTLELEIDDIKIENLDVFSQLLIESGIGLDIPTIVLEIKTSDQSELEHVRPGSTIKVNYGNNKVVTSTEFVIVKTQMKPGRQVSLMRLHGLYKPDFITEFDNYYADGPSVSAIESVAGQFMPVTNEAATTSDSMTWISYSTPKRFVLDTWLRSYYPNDLLLVGIDVEGMRLRNLTSITDSKYVVGANKDLEPTSYEINARMTKYWQDVKVVSDDWKSDSPSWNLTSSDSWSNFTSEPDDWRSNKLLFIDSKSENVHDNWNEALDRNLSELPTFQSIMNVSVPLVWDVRVLDALDIVSDELDLILTGTYIVGSYTIKITGSDATSTYSLFRESVSL